MSSQSPLILDNSVNDDRPSTPVAVETFNLRKVYLTGFWLNQRIESLKSCTLRVYQGETFGLLGPNGAGKTTLLKTLLGIVRATSGRAMLLGHPIGDRKVKERIGYLPENAYYYDYLTGCEFLDLIGGIFEIPPKLRKKRIAELLDMVGLDRKTAEKKQLRRYSKGMMQRIGMAQTLINDPELVFLDEPMSGLDPVGRYQVREIIMSLKEQGKTIFFNSHVLADVEKICDRIAILARGELICMGSLEEILGSDDSYQVVIRGGEEGQIKNWMSGVSWQDGCWHGQIKGNPHEFLSFVNSAGLELVSFNKARASLEDYFIRQLQERGITNSQ